MSSATATGRGAALPSLTGVRGIAAFGVFASHLHYLFPVERSVTGVAGPGGNLQRILSWGANGVSLFFVLSGFVLAWTWTDGTDSRTFWRRRFARVWPLHAAIWAAFALLPLLHAGPGIRPASGLASLVLVQCWIPGLGWANAVNPVAWTLSCEAFFYLVFPMVIRAIRRLSASGLLRAAAAVTTAGSLVVVAFLEPRGITVSTFPPFRVWEFVLGILAGTAIRAGWLRSVPPLAASCLLLFTALAASTWVSGLRGVGIALTTVAFTGIISALALGDLRARSSSPLRSQVARRGGEWSYAFYLVQLYPLALLFGWGWSAHHWWETSLVMTGWFGVTVAGAAALHHLVEKPAVVALRPPGQVRVPVS